MKASTKAQLEQDLISVRDALIEMPKGSRPHLHALYVEAGIFGASWDEDGKVQYGSDGERVREHRVYLAIKDHAWFAKSEKKADVELTSSGRKAAQAAKRAAAKAAE